MEHPQAAGLAAAPRRLCCLLFQVAKLIQMAIEEDAALHGCNIISASPSRSGLKWRGGTTPRFSGTCPTRHHFLCYAGHIRLRHRRRRNVLGIQPLRCSASANGKLQGPVVLVDNYDSFTYNLSQVADHATCHLI